MLQHLDVRDRTDEQLAALYCAGERHAADELVRRYWPKAVGYAKKLGWVNDAEDFANETMVYVIKALERGHFNPNRAKFKTLFWTIQVRRLIDRDRAHERHEGREVVAGVGREEAPEAESGPDGLAIAAAREPSPSAEDTVIEKEEAARREREADEVWKCLNDLPVLDRAVLLQQSEKFSVADSAKMLGVNENKVRNIRNRAPQRIRECLRARGVFDTGDDRDEEQA